MAIGEILKRPWAKAKRYLEALDWAANYDPLEEQRQWIAGLEARIARMEAASSSGHEGSTVKAPET